MGRPRLKQLSGGRLVFRPLTQATWADLESLFGPRGACGGCWCMWWRLRRSAYDRSKGPGNKRLLHHLVRAGRPSGVLAYRRGEPVGWCAIAPREDYPVLQGSRILEPVDSRPVWSVTCFFVGRNARRSGITVPLLEAAVAYARRRGARIVEGYPHEPRAARMPDLFAATGLAATFRAAGFVEVLRRSPSRPIMRRVLRGRRDRLV